MDSLLKGMFGGADDDDDNVRRGRAQDFVSRYETGAPEDGLDADEVRQNYGRVTNNVDDDTYQRSAEQAYGRMSSDQRSQLGQMLQQRMGGQQVGGNVDDPRELASLTSRFRKDNPGGLESLFGGGGGGGGGGGIGGMLGGILGGGGGDNDDQRRSNTGGGGGGGMGGMLDSPLAKAALGGIAAMAFKNMMGKR